MVKKRIAAVVSALGLVGAVPLASSEAARPIAHVSCQYAQIQGHTKCIARGQFCKRSAESDYRRHGYTCSKRDRNGRYHLQ
jgi:hypothetical protein